MESFSFDPWGKRRAATLTQLQNLLGNWSTLNTYQKGNLTIPALSLASLTTDRGFTGHRQMDGVGLIHMGGRVYDAEIGRFLSADPFVRDLTNLQALNRYTYVENNPLSYTDPSGYFLKKLVKGIGKAIGKLVDGIGNAIKVGLQKIGRAFGEVPGLAAAIGAFVCGPAAAACWATFSKVMVGLNAAITVANGGTIGQVLQGAAIGMISNQVGGGLMGLFGDGMGAQAGVSMFMGGAVARAQGGKFIDGVKGAAIGLGVSYGVARIAAAAEIKRNPYLLADAGECRQSQSCMAASVALQDAQEGKSMLLNKDQSRNVFKIHGYDTDGVIMDRSAQTLATDMYFKALKADEGMIWVERVFKAFAGGFNPKPSGLLSLGSSTMSSGAKEYFRVGQYKSIEARLSATGAGIIHTNAANVDNRMRYFELRRE